MKKPTSEELSELLTRSIDTIYPDVESFKKLLETQRPLRVYVGIDPTATYIHLGHATNYFILRRLHRLGHKIIVLIGDFTAMIGDPSDKTAERQRLTRAQVEANLQTFKDQIGKVLDFNDQANPIEFRFNAEWLGNLNFHDVIELTSHFTIQQMLERDIFRRRLKENKPLHLHEVLYPVMQGYDSVALEADVEIGGTDQTFNMLAGRQLVKAYQQREKIVITTTLLENPVTGEKLMSKSLGTGIGLDETPEEMFGKSMTLPDRALLQCFTDCTDLPLVEIEKIKQELEAGANPRDLKLRLAREVVTLYHNAAAAKKAEANFINVFSKKNTPEELPVVEANAGEKLAAVLLKSKIVKSKTDFRRLITAGAVSDLDTSEALTDPEVTVKNNWKLKIGKKRFVKVVTK